MSVVNTASTADRMGWASSVLYRQAYGHARCWAKNDDSESF